MTELEGEQPTETNEPRSARRTTVIVVVAVVVVALLVVAFLVFRPTASTDAGGGAGTGAPTATTSGVPTTPGATDAASGAPTEPDGRATQAPVAFDDDAEALPGVTVTIAGLEAVDGEATGVGEVAGPAVRVSVEYVNGSDAEVDLRTVQVTADAGADRTASPELSGPGVLPFPAKLAPGERATAVYVFAVPTDQRDAFRVYVDSVVTAPVVLFEGAAPPA